VKAPSPPGNEFENTHNTIGYGLQNTRTQVVFVNVYLFVPEFGKELACHHLLDNG
jgi:hypothetical protein